MKQIPNLFTLLNLVFGCMAIVCVLQPGILLFPVDQDTGTILSAPVEFGYFTEKMFLAPLFIGLAAVVDFLDGFIARAFKATSGLGRQLDSLADVVSFGVAPGMIVYQFIRMGYAQESGALQTSQAWLLPAFIIPAAAAYRLGKFNIDDRQVTGFRGVPTPAVGLLIASFPLIYWFSDQLWAIKLLLSPWFWYGMIVLLAFLMASNLPMIALKFSSTSRAAIMPVIILVVIGAAAAIFLQWLAVPLVFIAYVVLSLLFKPKTS